MPGDMTDKNFTAQKAAVNGEKITQIATCAERISPRQDSCWSWVVCFAGVVSNIVICGFTFSYGILFPALLDEFQQGKANTGSFSQRNQQQNIRERIMNQRIYERVNVLTKEN